jgi:hypothetical protein
MDIVSTNSSTMAVDAHYPHHSSKMSVDYVGQTLDAIGLWTIIVTLVVILGAYDQCMSVIPRSR